MAEHRTIARIITEGGQQAVGAFQNFGQRSRAEIDRLQQGVTPANAALRALSETSENVRGSLQNMAGPLGSIGTTLAGLGPVGLGAAAGLGAITIGLTQGLRAANEYERVQRRIQRQIENTGFAAGQSVRSLEIFARGIATSTNVTIDEVREAQSALLVFQNISGETFERVQRLAADLAEFGFGDMADAAQNLGELINDPLGALEELKSKGLVPATEAFANMVKGMVEAGDQAKLTETVLSAVEARVGGLAVSAGQGMTGALNAMSVELQLTWERLGQAANGTGVFSGAIQTATGVLVTFREALLGSGDEVEDLRKQLESFQGLSGILRKVIPFLPGQGIASLLGIGPEDRQSEAETQALLFFKQIEQQAQAQEQRAAQRRAQAVQDEQRALAQREKAQREFYNRVGRADDTLQKQIEENEQKRLRRGEHVYRRFIEFDDQLLSAVEENEQKRLKAREEAERQQEKFAAIKIARFKAHEERMTEVLAEEERKRTQIAFEEIESRAKKAEEARQRAARVEETVFNRGTVFGTIPQLTAGLTAPIEDELDDLAEKVRDTFSDAMRTAADNVTLILENVAEDDWLGAMDGFFRFATQGIEDLGRHFEALAEEAKAAGREFQSLQRTAGVLGTIGQVGGAAGLGVGLGSGVAGVAQQGGLSSGASGAIGGAVGGAVAGGVGTAALTGAALGSVVPVVGTIVGAVVGAALGAFAGGAFSGGRPPTFAEGIRTTATPPPLGETSDAAFRRSAFGVISIIEDAARGLAGFEVVETIAQLDNTLSQFLSEEQRLLAQQALQGTTTGEFSGESFGAVAGGVMAERIAQVLQAVVGGTEGAAVSERFLALNPRGTQEELARVAGEFFGIINLITQSLDNTQPLTQYEQAAKDLDATFAAAIPQALDYGFSIESLTAAQEAATAKLRQDVDERNRIRHLEITDPYQAAIERIGQINQQFLRDTIAVGGNIEQARAANIAAVQQVQREQAEARTRERLQAQAEAERRRDEARRRVEAARAAAEQRRAEIAARRESITSFVNSIRSDTIRIMNPARAAMFDLNIEMQGLIKTARELGFSEKQLAEVRRLGQVQAQAITKQRQAEVLAFNQQVTQQALELTDPIQAQLYAAKIQFQEQLRLAKDYGVSTIQIQKNYQAEQQRILEQGAQQQTSVVQDFIRNLLGGPQSPLSPQEVLKNARAQFIQASQARDPERFVEASQNFLSAAKEVGSTGPLFAAAFKQVTENAKLFGVHVSQISGGGGPQQAAQEQLKVQQRQLAESQQQNSRMVSVLTSIDGRMARLEGRMDTLIAATNASGNKIVTALKQRPKGSLAA